MIFINDIPSFRDPENFAVGIDDRVEKIDLINDVIVQDFGHILGGDVLSVECTFSPDNLVRFLELWENREKVSMTDTAGYVWEDLRIVLKQLKRDKHFPEYVTATFELWRK